MRHHSSSRFLPMSLLFFHDSIAECPVVFGTRTRQERDSENRVVRHSAVQNETRKKTYAFRHGVRFAS